MIAVSPKSLRSHCLCVACTPQSVSLSTVKAGISNVFPVQGLRSDLKGQPIADPEADSLQQSTPKDELQTDEGKEANLRRICSVQFAVFHGSKRKCCLAEIKTYHGCSAVQPLCTIHEAELWWWDLGRDRWLRDTLHVEMQL